MLSQRYKRLLKVQKILLDKLRDYVEKLHQSLTPLMLFYLPGYKYENASSANAYQYLFRFFF